MLVSRFPFLTSQPGAAALTRRELVRRVAPFGLVALGALVVAHLVPEGISTARLIAAWGVTVAVVVGSVALPWGMLPVVARTVPPLAYLGVVALLHEPGVSGAAPFDVLAVLPVAWLALYGRLRDLAVGLAGAAAALLLPAALGAHDGLEVDDWLRLVMWLLVAVVVGLVVHRLVGEIGEHAHEARHVVESATDAFVSIGVDGRILDWNPRAEELFGYTRAEAIGRDAVLTVIPPEGRDGHLANLAGLAQGVLVADPRRSVELMRRDGSRFTAGIAVSTVRRHGATRLDLFLHDATAREAARHALARSEERFRVAFREAPLGIALADLDGRLLDVNDTLCSVTGHSREELLGTVDRRLTHPDDVAGEMAALAPLRRGEIDNVTFEKRIVRPDGQPVWLSVHAARLRDVAGSPDQVLSQVVDVSDRRTFEAELQHLADHDPLTGLLNRRRFDEEVRRQVAHVNRYGSEGALLLLDLDHFKSVNDTFGHQAGDELVVSVARALSRHLRQSDVLARLGGDEFAVLLPKGDAETAGIVAGHLLQAIREEARFTSQARPRAVTASMGVALFVQGGLVSGEDVVACADLAMYDAKEAGRDRYWVYAAEDEAKTRVETRMSWAERIRQALEDGRFELLAQPILDLRTNKVHSHELLLRMIGEDGDRIAPGAFIPAAEHYDLIQQIDCWVIAHALRTIGDAHREGRRLELSVNVSGRSIDHPSVLATLERELEATGADPACLTIEITETAAVTNVPLARRFADHLGRLGVRLALDDFGAGFGSFYYLKHIPFDYLKIDGEFVKDCVTSRDDQLIIRALVQIAEGMGKETIAEFVTDADVQAFVAGEGVTYGQGFHIGVPDSLDRMVVVAAGT